MASCAAARMFAINATLCACDPGYYLSRSNGSSSCAAAPEWEWQVGAVGAPRNQSLYFLGPVLPIEVIRRLTQSQAVILESALAVLLIWLAFCAAARLFGRDPQGEKRLFRARFWVSRLDFIFDNSHWAFPVLARMCRLAAHHLVKEDNTVVQGRSIRPFLNLLYQAIKRRSIEVHRVKPANAPDLLSFVNDLEFNIITISGMSCAQATAPSAIAMGTPGFMDFRVVPLPTMFNYSCTNTSRGPSISLTCNGCRIPPRDHYVSWQFVDLPGQPAVAVGFQFNLTAKQHGVNEHVSFVSGAMNSDGYVDDGKMKTFRGQDSSVLKIQLFPQIYNKLGNLRLLQPLVQDFAEGSAFSDVGSLNASLQNAGDGVVNTTLYISYLSDYIVEISNESVVGPVSILASIGGLYAFSVAICLCFMAQVRKFVMYTWGPSNLDPTDRSGKQNEGSVMDSLHRPFHKRREPVRQTKSDANGSRRVPADMGAIDIEQDGEVQQPSSSR
ncbi:hypothetical protein PR202_ga25736 [Eleusine coracana subsp. coracana]|uniref:Uncharacterized protein n=1 Tax=Eleusine coracana subsp. coracana TaxID=191504 RepID=A0AAV5DCG0_ELECO|nr:hypothetical protein PR202_ga25736 [Eleusine coracana subsp. coracana]